MKLVSVNTSAAKPIERGQKSGMTGIFKTPQLEAVKVGQLGLEHDVQVDKKNHGGPDQAVYLYSADDYAWWSEQLGYILEPGTFGENLTLSNFGTDEVYVGDRFQIGEVLLEATAPRIPCSTLAARMNDQHFVKRFKEAERSGCYARVLSEGSVRAGDEVSYQRGESQLSVREFARLFYLKTLTKAQLEQLLAAPIDLRSRSYYEEMLAKQ